MIKYIFNRLLMLIPVVIGVTFLVFFIVSLTPGDTAAMIIGEGATQEAIKELRTEMGLDDPVIVQYGRYMKDLLTGNMGDSYSNGKAVSSEIASRFPNTFKLTILSILVSIIISIPIGVVSATKQYSIFDSLGMVLALIGISMPSFWLGLILIIIFALNLGWFPSGGADSFKSVILPAVTLGVASTASITRTTRSSMLEVIRQDYIRTAKAKGVSNKKVIRKHALKNALIPAITVIGLEFGVMLGGAILTETVFSWPGIGRLMVESIQRKDTPMVLGCIITFSVCFSIVNLVIDILYAYIDPRIKANYE
ncbi:nickel ABC transporter permease [Maledivibacter halophilus]|uniref:Nickel import system permease protein NikB n=1 Tax=Maledivibacter halophilus TaxID=36842 RepID=A0A1T5ICN8_9FIRM|nr:nickel ABC transporter permease [Maledivibacter halophilus]SKC36964.1 peptide/nickel transport system permease protein [Maledivibacter halophilus]